MNWTRFSLAAVCAMAVAISAEAAEVKLPKGVKRTEYMGWNDSLVMKGKKVQAIIVPQAGGRITQYSYKGENIIWENPASAGKTLLNSTKDFWMGGYQADIGPELKGIPEHKELWMGEHRIEGLRPSTIKTISPVDKNLGIRIEKDIMMDPDLGEIGLIQRVVNVSDKPVSYCIWDRTLCKSGGYAFFPLNTRSKFPAGWSIRKTVDGKYVYDSAAPLHANVKVLDGVLVAKAGGNEAKIGADSDAGWIAYALGKLLFVKYFPYYRNSNYTDGGNSVEIYFNNEVAELEPLSPETKLHPGAFYEFPEKWMLIPLEKEVKSYEDARALVEMVPETPF